MPAARAWCAFALCLTAVCTEPVAAQTPRVELEAVDRALGDAWSRRDVNTLMTFYADSAFTMWTGERIRRGKGEIRTFWQDLWADSSFAVVSGERTSFEMSDGGDMAYMGGRSTFRRKIDGVVANRAGGWVTIWRKLGGRWVIATEVWNLSG
ncbi:MAG: nuclear transport factor 2 family protein [Cytophagaceae bacterium]|nr:nuclear transport factor 2 family protein [Gemmatimonadaceae bacterium]